MALSEPDARILAALARLDDGAALSVPELCRATGLSESTIRTGLTRHHYWGSVRQSRRTRGTCPMEWRATSIGRAVMRQPMYRDLMAVPV
ncbi:hypothetical protein [Nocardia cyriacigeorgica]|uniref:hypothetical protein n=1 Tax=Nocardia cyriacigeorgica TaxID=135487 RepID=UPI001892D792|nr:hypothetical protein [Nocardia cyriacigeorgica]MBF6416968.1 hypothetical protein [Nocardia cyriacigeorgica]